MSIRIACMADIHGQLPDNLQASDNIDILLIAGDLCTGNLYRDANFLVDFNDWLNRQPVKHKIIIAGNHDFIFEKHKRLLPELNCHYLQDSEIKIGKLKIYGTPWTPIFFNWAFILSEKMLQEKWNLIPDDTDILLVHGPPLGIMDAVEVHGRAWENNFGLEQIGSKSLSDKIFQIKPKLVVFGHNHGQYGQLICQEIIFVNCSQVDDDYVMNKQPIIVELKGKMK